MSSQTKAAGIDVSHYQGTINWQSVKQTGIAFAYAKATDGSTTVDSQFKTNWQAMQTAGIARGAYHFFEPTSDATAQANNFIHTVGSLKSTDLPPVIDVEISNGVSNSQMISGVTTWLTLVEQGLGRTPMIYTVASFWNAHLNDQFGNYPLWIAHYDVQSPTIPKGWSKWAFWQHSQSGSVNGVTGSVDLDWFNGSVAGLQALLHGSTVSTPTAPVSVPTPPPAPPPASLPSQSVETNPVTYIVQPGDTLDGIAARLHVSPTALAQANNITNPDLIEVGQVLTIPA
jgi:lysozyme